MSERRQELLDIRTALMKGDPPYEMDPYMGTRKRAKGAPGLDELNGVGDFQPGIASTRLLFEKLVKIVDFLLERTR